MKARTVPPRSRIGPPRGQGGPGRRPSRRGRLHRAVPGKVAAPVEGAHPVAQAAGRSLGVGELVGGTGAGGPRIQAHPRSPAGVALDQERGRGLVAGQAPAEQHPRSPPGRGQLQDPDRDQPPGPPAAEVVGRDPARGGEGTAHGEGVPAQDQALRGPGQPGAEGVPGGSVPSSQAVQDLPGGGDEVAGGVEVPGGGGQRPHGKALELVSGGSRPRRPVPLHQPVHVDLAAAGEVAGGEEPPPGRGQVGDLAVHPVAEGFPGGAGPAGQVGRGHAAHLVELPAHHQIAPVQAEAGHVVGGGDAGAEAGPDHPVPHRHPSRRRAAGGGEVAPGIEGPVLVHRQVPAGPVQARPQRVPASSVPEGHRGRGDVPAQPKAPPA